MPSAAHRKLGPDALGSLTDDELLDLQFRQLDLQIEGSELEPRIEQMHERAGGARTCRSARTSGCRTSGSRRTAYRASPSRFTWRTRGWRSSRSRRCSKSKAATPNGACASCATRPVTRIDNAFELRRRRQRRRDVRQSRQGPYPEFYTPKPYSKSFVLHLDAWYAQSHPDEDFAETFAVWLTPSASGASATAAGPRSRSSKYMDG